MTTVYAVSEEEYIISSRSGLFNLFPGVTVNMDNVLNDFNEAQQFILFTEEAAAQQFATGNSNTLRHNSKTIVDTSQRAILQMDIDAELLKNKTTQPVTREVSSDVVGHMKPKTSRSAEAYVLQRADLLVEPTYLNLRIGAQSKNLTPSPMCTIS